MEKNIIDTIFDLQITTRLCHSFRSFLKGVNHAKNLLTDIYQR